MVAENRERTKPCRCCDISKDRGGLRDVTRRFGNVVATKEEKVRFSGEEERQSAVYIRRTNHRTQVCIGDESNAQPRRRLHTGRNTDLDPLQDGPIRRFMSRSMTYARNCDDGTSRHRRPAAEPRRSGETEGPQRPTPAMQPRLDGGQAKRGSGGLIPIGDLLDHPALPLVNNQANLVLQCGEHVGFRDGADDLAFAEDDTLAIPRGKTDIGVTGFTGSVDNAAHHRDADRLRSPS